MKRYFIAAIAVALNATNPSYAAEPVVSNAEDGIFVAFKSHPLVGIGEVHGWAQQQDFYSTLLRDPRFALEVGNIVLETGDAAYQNVIDGYVNGEAVSYPELRKVWADTIGFSPTVFSVGSINVYDTIRSINLKLPQNKRIKVWLGDPPTDWSKINAKADMGPLDAQRESYPAALIEENILKKGKKALVIYGIDHLRMGAFSDPHNLLSRITSSHPGSFFIVTPYLGYAVKDCAARFEAHLSNWPVPALITPIRGSSLESDIAVAGCGPVPPPPSMTPDQYNALMRDYTGLTSDALLYLGPRSQQTCSPASQDIYMDLAFRAELDRRNRIRSGRPISGFTGQENTASPQPLWPSGQCRFLGP